MRIADICTRSVVHVDADLSVRAAAVLMRKRHVGTLVVIEQPNGERVPIGMVTDRDIVVTVVAPDVDINALVVGDVMSTKLITCTESQDIFDAVQLMQVNGVRRLPVVNRQGGLCGMVSADDILGTLGTYMQKLAHALSREQMLEMEMRT
ncbi:CBS domain-containing protein [Oleiagrimonas sp. C23AA]|uniref:CBS domain-containing protein n=1 Tax=Oleiagrimonas sp. C23AA TaxID=2719047 RepID=UPI00142133C2|nr:CBS domain-containing protein [Oleiagrimonas sp. C23AA]NII11088.1 CBS domain-containing protein [Oleiagrimonas sp. C23AA]